MKISYLSYPILHCDETRIQVLQEPRKTAESNSYMWVRVGGPPTQLVTIRSDVTCDLLSGYHGHLQIDNSAGYNMITQSENIIPLGCWAHVHRKFFEMQKVKSKKGKTSKADVAVNLIGKPYPIEKEFKGAKKDFLY